MSRKRSPGRSADPDALADKTLDTAPSARYSAPVAGPSPSPHALLMIQRLAGNRVARQLAPPPVADGATTEPRPTDVASHIAGESIAPLAPAGKIDLASGAAVEGPLEGRSSDGQRIQLAPAVNLGDRIQRQSPAAEATDPIAELGRMGGLAQTVAAGSRGTEVADLQQALMSLGYAMPKSTKKTGEPDGIFGPETEAVVTAYQEAHDLRPSGQVDPPTLVRITREASAPVGPTASEPADQPGPATEAEEQEVTAELGSISEDELDAELDQLLAYLDDSTPRVPGFEAITATTQTEYSEGEFENTIQLLWQREQLTFTDAARKVASTNEAGEDAPTPSQGPTFQPDVPYAKRWALALIAVDYERGSDLDYLAKLLKKGSPYVASLSAETERVIQKLNPTASDMDKAIFDAIIGLSAETEPGDLSELVVTFSGHGGLGQIQGVDGESLDPRKDLSALADIGEEFGVHLIYILDTCRAGRLVTFAQSNAKVDILEQAQALPPGPQLAVQKVTDAATRLYQVTHRLGIEAHFLGNEVRRTRLARGKNYPGLEKVAGHLGELDNALHVIALHPMGADTDSQLPPVDGLMALHAEVEAQWTAAYMGHPNRKRAAMALLSKLARLFDAVNDYVNNLLQHAHSLTSGSGARDTAGDSGGQPSPTSGRGGT